MEEGDGGPVGDIYPICRHLELRILGREGQLYSEHVAGGKGCFICYNVRGSRGSGNSQKL
jgi:hypothetical protein